MESLNLWRKAVSTMYWGKKDHWVYISAMLLLCCTPLKAQIQTEVLDTLPQLLWESSGLARLGNQWITHNDSGDLPQLYVFDRNSAESSRVVTIQGAGHEDWEDVAADETHLYIGDFGNNNGSRQDLRIYKVPLSSLAQSTAVAEVISFSYEDQTDFTPSSETNFDAEALVSVGDSLYILTKERGRLGTTAYRLPKTPGTFEAQNSGSYAINGLVTGGDYDPITDQLWICGYSNILLPFVAVFEGVSGGEVLGGAVQKFGLTTGLAQIEALALDGEGQAYLTSEQFNRTSPSIESLARLFRFDTSLDEEEEEEEEEENPNEPELEDGDLILYRGVGETLLYYRLQTSKPIIGRALYDSTGRQLEFVPLENLTDGPLDLSLTPSCGILLQHSSNRRTADQSLPASGSVLSNS